MNLCLAVVCEGQIDGNRVPYKTAVVTFTLPQGRVSPESQTQIVQPTAAGMDPGALCLLGKASAMDRASLP